MTDPAYQIDESDYTLRGDLIEQVLQAIELADGPRLDLLLSPLHPADVADVLEQITKKDRADLVTLWRGGVDGEILSELSEPLRDEVVTGLDPDHLADAVRELESDDVVDLVEDLGCAQQEAVLDALEPFDRVAVEKALAYPEESAGRLMQVEVVRAPDHWSVGETIDFLRSSRSLPEHFYHVILVTPHMKPVGYVTLGRLLGARRDQRLTELLEDSFRTIRFDRDEADVAYIFNQYHLISAAVVDADERLVGVITIDDAMTVLDDEAEEDILRLAGVGDESEISDAVWSTTRYRLPWLAVNLVTAILASIIISLFEETIVALVALAVLMPIVASMGGNAGTQSLTVAVRALATRDLTGSNALRVIKREIAVGAINGVVFAIIMGLIGAVWFHSTSLGLVIAGAMVINLIVAGIAGTGVPILLEKMGVDPALASGAFVTTITDVIGFFAFLGMATVFLL